MACHFQYHFARRSGASGFQATVSGFSQAGYGGHWVVSLGAGGMAVHQRVCWPFIL